MKRSFLLLVTALITNSTIIFAAGVRYDAKVWRTVQTYELAILSKNLDAHMRELVAVKCNFRGKDIHHMKPNWYESLAKYSGRTREVRARVGHGRKTGLSRLQVDPDGFEWRGDHPLRSRLNTMA